MSKGIAIQTILLLLVGTIVAGILIYLVYSHTRSSVLTLSECRIKITDMCIRCKTSGGGICLAPATADNQDPCA